MNGSSSWKTLKIDFPGAVSPAVPTHRSLSRSLGCIDFHLTLLASPAANSNQPFIQNRRKKDKKEKSGSTKFREFERNRSISRSIPSICLTSFRIGNEEREEERAKRQILRNASEEIWKNGRARREMQRRGGSCCSAENRSRNSGERVKSVKPEKTETFSTLKVSG